VHQLAAGEVVTIVELVGRRARIITPVEGWVSTETREGVQIMRPCTMQHRTNEAFEHMFEQKFSRLKAQQSTGGHTDARNERSPSASPRSSPRDRSDSDGDRRGQQQGRARGTRASRAAAPEAGFVPKLAAPGTAQGPVVMATAAPAAAPAPQPGPGGSGGLLGPSPGPAAGAASTDLLSMDDPAAPGPGERPQAFDPFGNAAPAPAHEHAAAKIAELASTETAAE